METEQGNRLKLNKFGKRMMNNPKCRNAVVLILLFLLYMFVYMILLDNPYFSDEADVIQIGYLISKGGMLYRDIVSQHMPASYYLAALIALFAPTTLYQYRLGFYIFMSLMYVLLYNRHKKVISPIVLIITPLFFIFQLPYHQYGYAMLSDHWQGFGMVILLLELYRYMKEKRITIAMSVWISFAIQLTFGSAFMAAFSIAPIAIAVISIQIHEYLKTPADEKKEKRKAYLQEDLILVGIVLLPMVIIILYYAINGNLGNFIEGAYTLNRTVYPKYLGGYGSDITGIISSTFHSFAATYKQVFESFIHSDSFHPEHLGLLLMLVSNLAVSIRLIIKKHIAGGICWFMAVMLCGVRGFDGFHGLPYLFASSLSFGFVIFWCIERMVKQKAYFAGITAIVLTSFVLCNSPVQLRSSLKNISLLSAGTNPTKEFLDTILEPDDKIHITNVLQVMNSVDYQREQDFSGAISTPWTYEVYGEKELQILKENQTKVVFYTPGFELWSRQADEYGAPVADYIKTHYRQYRGTDLWILNDFWYTAMARLEYPEFYITDCTGDEEDYTDYINPGQSISQFLCPTKDGCEAVFLKLSYQEEKKPAGITVSIIDCDEDTIVGESHITENDMINDSWFPVLIKADIKASKQYEFRLDLDESDLGGGVCLSTNNGINENTYASIGNEKKNYSICMLVAQRKTGRKPHPYILSAENTEAFANIGIMGECIEYIHPDRNLHVDGVSIQIGKYAETANGTIGIRVRDEETGMTLAETSADTSVFGDSLYSEIPLPRFEMNKNHLYSICVYMIDSTKGEPAVGVTAEQFEKKRDVGYSNYSDEGELWDYCMRLMLATE